MRIVHCFFTFDMGGAQVLAVDLMNRLSGEHQVSLVVVNDAVSQALLTKLDRRVAVYRIGRQEGSRNPWPLLQLNLRLLALRPDLIHCHEPDIGRILRSPVGRKIYTIHDTGIPTTHYHHYQALVAISDAVRQELAARFERPIATVYNGISTAGFRRRTEYRPQGPIRLVQLSRLMHEKKGQHILLQALKLLQDQGSGRFTLDFVGTGPSLEHLRGLTRQLGLEGQVTFQGERGRDWLFAHLADYHLLVQPSLYEGFGLTILEGFAAGLPVLASDIEGPAEIIGRTPRGFLFRRGDAEDCAAKLLELSQQYEDGRMEALMVSSVPVTDQQYSLEACAEGYLQQYKAIIHQPQS